MFNEGLLRKKYQHIMDIILYMNNSWATTRINKDITYKEDIESLFLEVWDRIPEEDRTIIHMNLEFIICKSIEAQCPSSPEGGLTQLSETGRFWIIFNPYGRLKNRDSHLYILAHELAHVIYEHPKKSKDMDLEHKKNYIENIGEPEAHKKAQEWGFRPAEEDIPHIKGYIEAKK